MTLGEGGGQRCCCPVPGWPRGGAHPSRPHGAPAGFPELDALEAAPDRADTAPGTSVPGGYPTPAPPPQSSLPLGSAGTHRRTPVPPPARAITQPEATVGPEEGTGRGAGCVGPVHTRLENEQAGVPVVTGDSGQQAGQVWEGGLLEPLHRCQSPGTALESTPPSLPPAQLFPGLDVPACCLGPPHRDPSLASVLASGSSSAGSGMGTGMPAGRHGLLRRSAQTGVQGSENPLTTSPGSAVCPSQDEPVVAGQASAPRRGLAVRTRPREAPSTPAPVPFGLPWCRPSWQAARTHPARREGRGAPAGSSLTCRQWRAAAGDVCSGRCPMLLLGDGPGLSQAPGPRSISGTLTLGPWTEGSQRPWPSPWPRRPGSSSL